MTHLNVRLLVLAGVGLALAGCRIVVDTTVAADGSGTVDNAVVYSAEEVANFEQDPEKAGQSICGDLATGVAEGRTFTQETRGGEIYCTTTFAFDSVSELRREYDRLGAVTVNKLDLTFGQLTFDLRVDLSANEAGQGLAQEWRLTLPAAPTTHNADRVEGQTLIWEIAPGEVGQIQAETKVGLSWQSLGWVRGLLLLVVGAVVIVVVGYLVVKGRRSAG